MADTRRRGQRRGVTEQDAQDQVVAPVYVKPTAEAVDTYVRTPDTSQQLVNALAKLDPTVGQFSQQLGLEYAKDQRAAGEKKAREESIRGSKLGEETRLGTLPMQDNPYFMAGLREEQGRMAADDWRVQWQKAQSEDPNYAFLKNATSLDAYDAAALDFRTQYMQKLGADGDKRDQAFERGFGSMSDAIWQHERLAFAKGIEAKLSEQAQAMAASRFSMVLRQGFDADAKDNNDFIVGHINDLAKGFVAMGMKPKDVYAKLADAVAETAQVMKLDDGEKLIALAERLDGIGNASGGKLKDDEGVKKLFDSVHDELNQEEFQRVKRNQEAIDHARQERENEFAVSVNKWYVEKGASAGIPTALLKQYKDVRNATQIVNGLQSNYRNAVYDTDPAALNKALKGVVNGDLNKLSIVQLGRISPHDKAFLMNALDDMTRAKHDGTMESLHKNPAFSNEFHKILPGYYSNDGVVQAEDGARLGNAEALFQNKALEYWEKGGRNDPPQRQVEMFRLLAHQSAEANKPTFGIDKFDPATGARYPSGNTTPGEPPKAPNNFPAPKISAPLKQALLIPAGVTPQVVHLAADPRGGAEHDVAYTELVSALKQAQVPINFNDPRAIVDYIDAMADSLKDGKQ